MLLLLVNFNSLFEPILLQVPKQILDHKKVHDLIFNLIPFIKGFDPQFDPDKAHKKPSNYHSDQCVPHQKTYVFCHAVKLFFFICTFKDMEKYCMLLNSTDLDLSNDLKFKTQFRYFQFEI